MWLVIREVTERQPLTSCGSSPPFTHIFFLFVCFFNSPWLFLAAGTSVQCMGFKKKKKKRFFRYTHPPRASQPILLLERWSIEMINLHNGALNWPITPTSQQPAPMESLQRVAIALDGVTCIFFAGVSFHHAGWGIWLVNMVLNNADSYSWVMCCRIEKFMLKEHLSHRMGKDA